jgi:hypothetical protein
MNTDTIQFDKLFDADEHYRSGRCPWTFFAYPTALADDRGLPPDDKACELLGHLQKRGIDVAVWIDGIENDTNYFACRKEDMYILHDTLQQLESQGIIEKDFCLARSERLFALATKSTEPSVATKPPS